MDCFNNTCLACDRECEGNYCSQACKLVDDERGTQMFSQKSPSSPNASRSWQSSSQSPVDLSYSGSRRPPSTSYFTWNPSMESASQRASADRVLTPSSSRCSLSSTTSSSNSSHAISAHDTQHLQDYFNSLNKAQAAKRRSSTR